MSKEYYHIKANGIRNELKEIRKAVDKLTAAIIMIAQTNKHNEVYNDYGAVSADDGLRKYKDKKESHNRCNNLIFKFFMIVVRDKHPMWV